MTGWRSATGPRPSTSCRARWTSTPARAGWRPTSSCAWSAARGCCSPPTTAPSTSSADARGPVGIDQRRWTLTWGGRCRPAARSPRTPSSSTLRRQRDAGRRPHRRGLRAMKAAGSADPNLLDADTVMTLGACASAGVSPLRVLRGGRWNARILLGAATGGDRASSGARRGVGDAHHQHPRRGDEEGAADMAGESTVIVQLQLQGAQVFAAEARTAPDGAGVRRRRREEGREGRQADTGMMAADGPAAITAGAAFRALAVKVDFDAVRRFEESRKIGKQTRAVIKSTGGAANVTAGQVGDLTGSISRRPVSTTRRSSPAPEPAADVQEHPQRDRQGQRHLQPDHQGGRRHGRGAWGSTPSRPDAARQGAQRPDQGPDELQALGVHLHRPADEQHHRPPPTSGRTMPAPASAGDALAGESNSRVRRLGACAGEPLGQDPVAAGNLQEAFGGRPGARHQLVIRGIQRFAASKTGQAAMRAFGGAAGAYALRFVALTSRRPPRGPASHRRWTASSSGPAHSGFILLALAIMRIPAHGQDVPADRWGDRRRRLPARACSNYRRRARRL